MPDSDNRPLSAFPPETSPSLVDEEHMPPPLIPRLLNALRGAKQPGGSLPGAKWLRRGVVLAVLIALFIAGRHGVARVRETEVGVMVNNVTGNLELKPRVGYYLSIPYLHEMHVLDKTIQRLDMNWRQGIGSSSRDLKLKTSDGSNVSVDLVINFKLNPDKAVEVLRRCGPGVGFTSTWMEPFARHVCFTTFGQLTTEEMYDAAKRNERAQKSLEELNTALGPQGIEVVAVIPGEFRFYKEYEQVIQEKKLADQQVEEQQAQARAALEDQARQIVEATKKADTTMASFEGECANKLIQAKAEADKAKLEADGRYAATLLSADAALYSATKQAAGERAKLLAEAEGMEQMRKAMSGEGGLSMIGMEYAKHLSGIKFTATPIARDPSVHQFAVQPGEVAAGATKPAAAMPAATPAPAAAPAPGVPVPVSAMPTALPGAPDTPLPPGVGMMYVPPPTTAAPAGGTTGH